MLYFVMLLSFYIFFQVNIFDYFNYLKYQLYII